MAATASPHVLHEYKTTFMLWLAPLLIGIGCLVTGMAVGFPFLLRNAPRDLSFFTTIGIAGVCGVATMLGAVALWLFIPAITTTFDPARRVLRLEYRRPLGRSVKEYRLDDVADIGPLYTGERSYSLAMTLKSGQTVRLDLSGSSDTTATRQTAERIKAILGLNRPPVRI